MIGVKTKTELVKDNSGAVINALKKLTSKDVLVGVPSEDSNRTGSGVTNAALAYIHDNGSPSANIPARAFLDPGIMNAMDRIQVRLKKMGIEVLDGNTAAVDDGLNAIGLIAVNSIRAKITSGPFAPLAPSTLRARRRRGRTGTRPLIDTAQLRNSINYVVREK